jgi:hypothetical protein
MFVPEKPRFGREKVAMARENCGLLLAPRCEWNNLGPGKLCQQIAIRRLGGSIDDPDFAILPCSTCVGARHDGFGIRQTRNGTRGAAE